MCVYSSFFGERSIDRTAMADDDHPLGGSLALPLQEAVVDGERVFQILAAKTNQANLKLAVEDAQHQQAEYLTSFQADGWRGCTKSNERRGHAQVELAALIAATRVRRRVCELLDGRELPESMFGPLADYWYQQKYAWVLDEMRAVAQSASNVVAGGEATSSSSSKAEEERLVHLYVQRRRDVATTVVVGRLDASLTAESNEDRGDLLRQLVDGEALTLQMYTHLFPHTAEYDRCKMTRAEFVHNAG